MVQRSAMLGLRILGCWIACLCYSVGAASEFMRRKGSLHHISAAGNGQWKIAEHGFLGWLSQQKAMGVRTPFGCNCQGTTKGAGGPGCSGGAGGGVGYMMPAPTTTMTPPAQPPIPGPPPPVPLPGPPPPLPLAPAAPLPGLPGLPGISIDMLPTLGPPPLYKMTPAPTMPPWWGQPVTTPAPPTTPGPTTPAWVETQFGWIAGTTPSPYARFTTRSPWATPQPPAAAPAPGPAPGAAPAPAPMVQPVFSGASLVQKEAGSWSPLAFLHRSLGHHSDVGQPCDCPCNQDPRARAVDQDFRAVLNSP